MSKNNATWQRFALLPALLLLLLLLPDQAVRGHRVLNCRTLAREMYALGVPIDQLARWTYLAEIKSSYQTDAVSIKDANGYRYYGLFQMSDQYFCKSSDHPDAPNICNVRCDDLLSDDISAAVKCAQLVHSKEGFKPWGRDIKYPSPESIMNCFEDVQQPQFNRNMQNRTAVEDPSGRNSRHLTLEENGIGLPEACYKPEFQ